MTAGRERHEESGRRLPFSDGFGPFHSAAVAADASRGCTDSLSHLCGSGGLLRLQGLPDQPLDPCLLLSVSRGIASDDLLDPFLDPRLLLRVAAAFPLGESDRRQCYCRGEDEGRY